MTDFSFSSGVLYRFELLTLPPVFELFLYIVQTAGALPASTLSAMNFQPHKGFKIYITEIVTNGTCPPRTTQVSF